MYICGIRYYRSEGDSGKPRCIWQTLEQPLKKKKNSKIYFKKSFTNLQCYIIKYSLNAKKVIKKK